MIGVADDVRARLGVLVAGLRVPLDDATRPLVDGLVDVAYTCAAGGVPADAVVDAVRAILDDMTQQARILRLDRLGPATLESALARHRLPDGIRSDDEAP